MKILVGIDERHGRGRICQAVALESVTSEPDGLSRGIKDWGFCAPHSPQFDDTDGING